MSDNQPITYQLILTKDGEIETVNTPEMTEFVRRLTACLNACEGLSTEELERGIVQDMQKAIGEVVPLLTEHHNVLQENVHLKARAA
jgi:hypothetical protein